MGLSLPQQVPSLSGSSGRRMNPNTVDIFLPSRTTPRAPVILGSPTSLPSIRLDKGINWRLNMSCNDGSGFGRSMYMGEVEAVFVKRCTFCLLQQRRRCELMITDFREECAIVTDRSSASHCSARRSAVTIGSSHPHIRLQVKYKGETGP
ncbi:uncharacterized protein LOC124664116 [Lolium rigidum]|uniref:uncharacterized protein LOC124664116 n=1 Tax=Lolium rigidum TaxID=89674 RepID=UPI001F5C903A|nr:uncharacterized protein LOC124664116 [Lolium rigidum]